MTVGLATIHHEGAGAPTDVPRGAEGGYSIWIGITTYTILRTPEESYATKGYNHVSLDICLSGNRQTYPVTNGDIELIRRAVTDVRNRGWVTDRPSVEPHRASYNTVCPGDQTMTRWSEVVAACQLTPTPPPTKATIMFELVSWCYFNHKTLGKTVAAVDPNGRVYTLPTDAWQGEPFNNAYWLKNGVPRVPKAIEANSKNGYTVTATTGETYNYPP